MYFKLYSNRRVTYSHNVPIVGKETLIEQSYFDFQSLNGREVVKRR